MLSHTNALRTFARRTFCTPPFYENVLSHRTYAKRVRSDFKAQCRKRWMTHIVDKLNASLDAHDLGLFYRTLKQKGVSVAGISRESIQSFTLDELRGQAQKSSGVLDPVSPDLIARVVPQLPVFEPLGIAPTEQEISEALHCLRESAPGKDEVTINMLKFAGPRARWQLRLLMHKMWVSGPATWDSLATHGLAVALYKGTGDRGDLDNHRFVVLLSAISRIIARILATRISEWAERRNLLPSSQWGFRKHRSTQDALFLSRLLVELEAEVRGLEDRPLNELLVLIDIQNAYPRVQRESAWIIFSRLGMPPNTIRLLRGLHDHTTYQCRGRQGMSDPYEQLTGFREGCCTSLILYSLFHTSRGHYLTSTRNAKTLLESAPCLVSLSTPA